MKNRKKRTQQLREERNALYHDLVRRNIALADKNTELSIINNSLQNALNTANNLLKKADQYINRKRWWQFWRWFN